MKTLAKTKYYDQVSSEFFDRLTRCVPQNFEATAIDFFARDRLTRFPHDLDVGDWTNPHIVCPGFTSAFNYQILFSLNEVLRYNTNNQGLGPDILTVAASACGPIFHEPTSSSLTTQGIRESLNSDEWFSLAMDWAYSTSSVAHNFNLASTYEPLFQTEDGVKSRHATLREIFHACAEKYSTNFANPQDDLNFLSLYKNVQSSGFIPSPIVAHHLKSKGGHAGIPVADLGIRIAPDDLYGALVFFLRDCGCCPYRQTPPPAHSRFIPQQSIVDEVTERLAPLVTPQDMAALYQLVHDYDVRLEVASLRSLLPAPFVGTSLKNQKQL